MTTANQGLRQRLSSSIDFHVAATLLLRGWMLIAGAITVIGIPFWLNPIEQGYYFTFASILAIQIFFELGFNYVLIQFTAAEMAQLRCNRRGVLRGSPTALARLGSLTQLSRRIYFWLATGYLLVVSMSGLLFFSHAREQKPEFWALAWTLMVIFASGNLLLSPRLALAEGAGRVGQIARLRTLQSVVGYTGAWVAFALGAGLLAVPIISGTALAGSCIWLWRDRRFFASLERNASRLKTSRIIWKDEIFPFQWRIALSWISGYLIFQLFNPILFHQYGPREAGRVGLLLAIFNALITLAMSLVNAKGPLIASLLSAGQRASAKQLFKRQFWSSTVIFITLIIISLVVTFYFLPYSPHLRERLPSDSVIWWLTIVSASNQIVFSLAVFMRAHGEEPLVLPSVATGLATLAVVLIASQYSIELTMAGYTAVQVFICLPWVASVFIRRFWNRT